MASWLTAGQADDLQPGTLRVVQAGRKRLAVCNVDNEIHCVEDVCTHDGASFDTGELDGNEIECPRHGARFDVTTGRATCLPAITPVKVYPVRIENGEIQIQVD
ncbi:MAG: non-heme iron oxygenase ferredoxin subunit [Chloroflexota bacterium]